MKIYIKYIKRFNMYNILIDKHLFISFKLINKRLLVKMSLKAYNYMLLIKILRQFGLAKPLINLKNY